MNSAIVPTLYQQLKKNGLIGDDVQRPDGTDARVIVAANGENVYPDDVETLLGKIDGVKELAIVGIDDGKGGERVACLAIA